MRWFQYRIWRSASICALILFALLNLCNPLDRLLALPLQLSLERSPTMLFLGSSVVAVPLAEMELAKPRIADNKWSHLFDAASRISTVESILSANGVAVPVVSNLSFTSEMIDNSTHLLEQYVHDDKRPQLLFVGIAPIAILAGAASSAPPQEGHRLNLQELQKRALTPLTFYMNRSRFLLAMTKATHRAYNILGVPLPASKDTWKASLREYAANYKTMKSIEPGLHSLDCLLATCRKRSINVVLVNMPLHQANRDLMDSGFYQKYKQGVAASVSKSRVAYVDLGDSTEFTDADFFDPAHLNDQGGYKLLGHVLPKILAYIPHDAHKGEMASSGAVPK